MLLTKETKTNKTTKNLWQTSVQNCSTWFDLPPFWIACKQIFFEIEITFAMNSTKMQSLYLLKKIKKKKKHILLFQEKVPPFLLNDPRI